MKNIPDVLMSIKGSVNQKQKQFKDNAVFYNEDDNLRLSPFYEQ